MLPGEGENMGQREQVSVMPPLTKGRRKDASYREIGTRNIKAESGNSITPKRYYVTPLTTSMI